MSNRSQVTSLELVQQLKTEEDYWPKHYHELISDSMVSENVEPLLLKVLLEMEKVDIEVKEAYGILHNQDIQKEWNETTNSYDDVPKEPHIHFLFKFSRGYTLNYIAGAVGVNPQQFQKTKSGRYGFDNVLAYLIHAKDLNKHQYSPDNVVSIEGKGEPYKSIYQRRIETWIRGRAKKKAQSTYESVDYLIDEILSGRLDKNRIMLTDELYEIYGLHKRKITEALETAGEKQSYQAIHDIENGKFKKTVLFIQAKSGVGKTRLAKKITANIKNLMFEETNVLWQYSLTASSNAFDDYNGQQILILDDIRGYSLTVSDWLKLLDPYSISPISARYKNRLGAAKVIIITSTQQPIDFFKSTKYNDKEDIGQFIRRFDFLIEISDGYYLSSPIKNTNFAVSSNNNLGFDMLSHDFGNKSKMTEEEAHSEILKIVKENNKLNTKKASITPTKKMIEE